MEANRFALIVANSEYEDPELRQLLAPAHDAESLARVLANPAIGGFEVETLVNQQSGKVSQAIEEFFTVTDRKRDDLLLLYFSGHGIKDDDGQLYFAARDTRLVRHRPLRATAVSAAFVSEMLRSTRSRRQVLLLDCCYSGAFAKALMAKGDDSAGIRDHFQEGRGLVVLTASDSLQYSLEDHTAETGGVRSVFTRNVVKALETGEADRDGDGSVSLDELYEYVLDRVTQETPQQRPRKWDLDIEGRIYIARSPAPVKASKLPPELQDSIEDRRPWVRLGAIQELATLLTGTHRGLALAARETLQGLQEDDSLQVRNAAAKCLAGTEAPAQTPDGGAGEAEAAAAKAAAEAAEQERLAKAKAEQDRAAAARAEEERLEKEKAAQEELKRQKAEARRVAAQERLAKQKAEEERLAKEKAQREAEAAQARVAKEEAEKERRQQETEERAARQKAEVERLAAARSERERREREAAEEQRAGEDPRVLDQREQLRREIERSKQERLRREAAKSPQKAPGPTGTPVGMPTAPKRLATLWKVLLAAGVLVAAIVFWPHSHETTPQPAGRTVTDSNTNGQPTAASVDIKTPVAAGEHKAPERAAAGMQYALNRILTGHTGEVMQVSFSPDGKTLASASRDGSVKLWETASGRALASLPVEDANTAVFSPDGRTLAAAGETAAIHLFDAATGMPAGILGDASARGVRLPDGSSTSEGIYSVDYSPDGRYLAAAQISGLRIYAAGKQAEAPNVFAPLVVKFSPDGNWLASAGNALGQPGPIRIWRMGTWQPHHTLKPALDAAAVAFSPDGKLLASGGEDKMVTVWDVRTGEQVRTLPGVGAKVRGLAFRPDGRELACSASGVAILWDTSTWSEVQRLAHDAPAGSVGRGVNNLAFSPDGSLLATGGQDKTRVRLWRSQ